MLNLTALKNTLFPLQCLNCQKASAKAICPSCFNQLPWLRDGCYICGNAITGKPASKNICGKCLTTPPFFDHTIAALRYQEPISHLLTQLKFSEKLNNVSILSNLLLAKVNQEALPDLILPVPLHKKRIQHRGFNQALEISKKLSKQLNIPVDTTAIKRVKNTTPQSSLPAKHRQKNIKNAFELIQPIKAKHIAIVDDIVTTGNTVNELARMIKKQQDCYIEVWCVART